MATETVVNDQRLPRAAIERMLKNERDRKGACDVDVFSKEPHKADSLPTPSKTSTTKDLEDDSFAAYRKLSHPVDENLLATNVKFSSAKGTIANRVLHNLLRSGDSAQKYLQAYGSKKVSQQNSKRSKKRMSTKQLKKSGSWNFPKNLQKFDLFKPMHSMWETYMMQLIKVTGKIQLAPTLFSTDLHGAFMFVAESKIASFTGVQGIMVRETSETFGIITRDDKFQVVPKKLSVFIIQLDCWKITLHGDKFTSRDNVLQR